jgi:hypothetical protein
MRKLIGPVAAVLAFVLQIPIATAQDDANTVVQLNPDSEQRKIERRARIEELRQLTQEERQAKRQANQQQLDSLSDEQRQALREKRRSREAARARQGGRPGAANRARPRAQ